MKLVNLLILAMLVTASCGLFDHNDNVDPVTPTLEEVCDDIGIPANLIIISTDVVPGPTGFDLIGPSDLFKALEDYVPQYGGYIFRSYLSLGVFLIAPPENHEAFLDSLQIALNNHSITGEQNIHFENDRVIAELLSIGEPTPIALRKTTDDNEYNWEDEQIDLISAHEAGYDGTGAKVIIVDTGIDITHPELEGLYDPTLSEALLFDSNLVDTTSGYEFEEIVSPSYDIHGHGTFVAGMVAAALNEQGAVGIAPNVRIGSVKIFGTSGSTTTSAILNGFFFILNQADEPENEGKLIVNMSFGGVLFSHTMNIALERLYQEGVVLVAASGNLYSLPVSYPASFSNTLAVGATNEDGEKAHFTSYRGNNLNILAPGEDVYSILPGDGYAEWTGTSFSSPIVAGAIALYIQKRIDDGLNLVPNHVIYTKIYESGLQPEEYSEYDWNYHTGWGIIQVSRLLGLN